jgi:hypothetical protein
MKPELPESRIRVGLNSFGSITLNLKIVLQYIIFLCSCMVLFMVFNTVFMYKTLIIIIFCRSKIFFQTNETKNYRFRYALRWLRHGYRTEGMSMANLSCTAVGMKLSKFFLHHKIGKSIFF